MIINTTTNTYNNVGLYKATHSKTVVGYRGQHGHLHFTGEAERSTHPRTAFLYFSDESQVDEMLEHLKILKAEMRLQAIKHQRAQDAA